MDQNKTIEELFRRYLDNSCTPEEIRSLFQYFGNEENEVELRRLIRQQLEAKADLDISHQKSKENLLNDVFLKIKEAINKDEKVNHSRVIPFYRNKWFRASAAAVFVFLLSGTAFLLLRQDKSANIAVHENEIHEPGDIVPGKNNATLTLDDGTTILLDSAANGTLAQQGNTDVLKINGQIAYQKKDGKALNTKPVYNTVTTANGNQYQLVLTDGTKVWLNAASSIRFPASFMGNERKVEITGEVYFEVAKNAKKPFKVIVKNQTGPAEEIEVLGTHFNVNAYSEEPDIKTTLLEGSVKIKHEDVVQMLTPGQQAKLTSNGISLNNDVDLQQVMAWKNGYFLFNSTDLYTLMRQVARWYNVEVEFEGKISGDSFSGKISRDVPLSQFMKVLELNDVHVKREGRKVVIIP